GCMELPQAHDPGRVKASFGSRTVPISGDLRVHAGVLSCPRQSVTAAASWGKLGPFLRAVAARRGECGAAASLPDAYQGQVRHRGVLTQLTDSVRREHEEAEECEIRVHVIGFCRRRRS